MRTSIGSAPGRIGRRAAHDAREPDRPGVVGDQKVVGVEPTVDVVERGEGLAEARTPHHDRPGQPRGVVGVQRLAQLQHHVVGDVDDQRDRPHPGREQAALHPPRRRRLRVDAVHAPGHEPQAALVGERDRPCLALDDRHGHAGGRVDVVDVGGGRDLPREPAHGERVAAVRGDVELDHRVAPADQRERVVARLGGVRGQHEDARVVGADAQLAGRGDHAVGHVPIGRAGGDREPARQHRARERDDDEIADREVGGAADHPARRLPPMPGIDCAGTVEESTSPDYRPGDQVIITGYDLGSGHWGGYAEFVRVPAEWIVPLPSGLTLRETMIYGTAGFTAAQCVAAIIARGIEPSRGPVVVTGSTGGVGSIAVAILAKLGYEVEAVTGKARTSRLAAQTWCSHDSQSR